MNKPLGILESVTPNNYENDQGIRARLFNSENKQSLDNYLSSHPYQDQLANHPEFGTQAAKADAYPLYSPNYVKQQQKNLEEFSNFIPANDPTSENLLDMQSRPMTDFFHNNMVPFSKKFSQNMAGTGVASGNYIDGSEMVDGLVNSGFDDSTPNKTNLSNFTGLDDTYLHKREIGPMFSPAEQQTGWVYGTPLFRAEEDRYTVGLNNLKHDQVPVEAIKVGPGLNIDPSIPAAGGFHDFTRILPNNVNDYKANQLPGQVIAGKYFSAALPTSYPGIGTSADESAPGIVKNKPNSYWDQARYPTMTTRVAIQPSNLDYNKANYEVDLKPGNARRDQMSYGLGNVEYRRGLREGFENTKTDGYEEDLSCVNQEVTIGQGPLGSSVPMSGTRSETWMSMDGNIRSRSDCNSQPTGAPNRASYGQGNIISNWYVNETDRGTVNPSSVMQLNLSSTGQGSSFYTYVDENRTTLKEMSNYAYAGNTSRPDQKTTNFWNYVDDQKTTSKETTQFSYTGNVARPDQKVTNSWKFVDELPTTTRETTQFAYAGNVAGATTAETNRSMFTGFSG